MTTKAKPASPLPMILRHMDQSLFFTAAIPQDSAYIKHAIVAYPKLVEEIKRLCAEIPQVLGSDKPMSNSLLRELGEE
jgi:hypothetical protein